MNYTITSKTIKNYIKPIFTLQLSNIFKSDIIYSYIIKCSTNSSIYEIVSSKTSPFPLTIQISDRKEIRSSWERRKSEKYSVILIPFPERRTG